MALVERIARFGDRVFDRLRDQRAFALSYEGATDGDLEGLRNHKYALLVTFRRSGEAVPSPVWFGIGDGGHAYVKSADGVGKVKRIRGDSRVLVAPCNARGKPVGPAVRGRARLLPKPEWEHAERTLAAAYGPTRTSFERILGGPEDSAVYIEITPSDRPQL